LYLSSKLNETPIRLRDLINTYILISARIKHLLALPANQPFPVNEEGAGDMWMIGAGNGKGKEKEKLWEGFVFEVPGFHDEVFWDCELEGPRGEVDELTETREGCDSRVGDADLEAPRIQHAGELMMYLGVSPD